MNDAAVPGVSGGSSDAWGPGDGGGEDILRLTGVTRAFGNVLAVDNLSLGVRRGEFITLLGPSGCGKTTALRLIAGFESPNAGAVSFDGVEVTGWTPQRRGFGMVFQNYALFPHLNVFENVAFGLRARKVAEPRVKDRVGEALRIVDLDGYGERAVQALSGGQQQRVALARALAIEPPLLLLDEPLSNLDQALRVRTRTELRALVKKLGITAIFVTHDQEEAFDLSDRIAVMRAGRIRQFGAPRELYDSPVDRFVAGFVGRANTLPVRVEQGAVQLGGGVTWPLPRGVDAPAREAALLFRPEAVTFASGASTVAERGSERSPERGSERGSERVVPVPLPGVVRAERFRGAVTFYEVEVEAREGLARDGVDGRAAGEPGSGTTTVFEVASAPGGPRPGTRVGLVPLPDARLHLFPRDEHRDAPGDDRRDDRGVEGRS